MNDRQEGLTNRIAQIKLKRILEFNFRLKEALLRDRITASNASLSIINYTQNTPDYILSGLWDLPPEQNKFRQYQEIKKLRHANSNNIGCCTIV